MDNKIHLLPHQLQTLDVLKDFSRCAMYLDMGLGKTFTGSEKMRVLGNNVNLVICQKSKVSDWVAHFEKYYSDIYEIYNLSEKRKKQKELCSLALNKAINNYLEVKGYVFIINYDLVIRRCELLSLHNFTLMLDESSLIQHYSAKRTRTIMKYRFDNLILLSGTPCGGKYENLWTQLKMLGYNITKRSFWDMYVKYWVDNSQGFPITHVSGYKNVDLLKSKMKDFGCILMKSEDVLDLPKQIFSDVFVSNTKEYDNFLKYDMVEINGQNLIAENSLVKLLHCRQLAGAFNENKIVACGELLQSTYDRVIIFYNFSLERIELEKMCKKLKRPVSVVCGAKKDLTSYCDEESSVTLVQYQAGAMGLNLQLANKILFFSPPLSYELFEQSQKRIHRIGQERTCFYYFLKTKFSVEENIYNTLALRKDYTDELFKVEYDFIRNKKHD